MQFGLCIFGWFSKYSGLIINSVLISFRACTSWYHVHFIACLFPIVDLNCNSISWKWIFNFSWTSGMDVAYSSKIVHFNWLNGWMFEWIWTSCSKLQNAFKPFYTLLSIALLGLFTVQVLFPSVAYLWAHSQRFDAIKLNKVNLICSHHIQRLEFD